MYGLGRRGLLPAGWVPGAPHSGPAIRGRTCGALIVSPLRAGTPRARVPGPGNPRPAVTASAGYCEALRASWAAPSGVDPGAPSPPSAAGPGVGPQPTSAIRN